MFDKNNRFVTKGILSQLPQDIIIPLWLSVDIQNNAGAKMDYLQIFRFEKVSDIVLAIRHEQEVPKRQTVLYCDYKPEYEPILSKTVYIIDEGEHCIMLFAEER